jgi:hypothetical protein
MTMLNTSSRECLEWEKVHVPQIQWLVISSTMLEHLNVKIRPFVLYLHMHRMDTGHTFNPKRFGSRMFNVLNLFIPSIPQRYDMFVNIDPIREPCCLQS